MCILSTSNTHQTHVLCLQSEYHLHDFLYFHEIEKEIVNPAK